ncbi:MAG TPA: hypothetical protein VLA13_04035 [Massilibacterium sp.]|nr:hypothetical protein [Massilibacterium sp.]
MSSTNRNSTRNKNDYYVTPIYAINNFLDKLEEFHNGMFHRKNVLDPCAGGDINNPMSYPTALKNKYNNSINHIETLDIREDSLANTKADFLSYTPEKKFDVVITNPPFVLAQEIIEKSFDVTSDDGYVIMLLRLNFFGGQKRKAFWDKHLPIYSFVHSKRMSFTETGGTDSIEYMHCVWSKKHKPNYTKLVII